MLDFYSANAILMAMNKIVNFFDKLEDKIRESLSRMPIVYTFIGGVAIVLFWRGVWITADLFPVLTGPVSILISVLVLLITGFFVSFFVGDVIIISGLKKEKKIIDKTESEVQRDITTLKEIKEEMDDIRKMLEKKQN